MKNLFKTMMLVAVAAMGFTACSNDKTADVAPEMEQKMVTMTITAEDATRTFLKEGEGVVNFGWNETGEALRVIEVVGAAYSTKATDRYTRPEEGKAKFEVSFPENVASNYTYYAVYPNANYVESENNNFDKFKVELPGAQNYVDGSYDPAADLMIAKPMNTTSQPQELNMQFTRLAALAKMTLKGMPEDKNITSLSFTATGKALAGRAYVNLNNAEVEEYGYSGQKEESITLTISEAAAINNDAVYFTCFPVELVEGNTFEVKAVTADKYTYTKSVTLTKDQSLAFTAGNLSTFTVNMSSAVVVAPGKVFTLLTDVSKLNVGDEIVITNKESAGSAYALSTTQNDNNRGQTKVTIQENKITAIDGVAVLTVGENNGYWTLYDPAKEGYLYAASSEKNYLRTQKTLDKNGEWSIEIANTGVATIKAQGTNTRNWLRKNSQDPIFSCYGSGQSDVYIYLNDCGTGEKPVAQPKLTVNPTTLSFEAAGGEKTFTATLENLEKEITATVVEADANWLTVEKKEGTTYTVTATEYTNTKEDRKATITVKAGDLTETIAVTQTKYVDPNAGGGEPSGNVYTKVTTAPADWSGTYLIVYEDGNKAFNGSYTDKLDKESNYKEITISNNNTIAVDTNTEAIEFTIAKSNTTYTIQSKSGLYMGQNSNSNGLQSHKTTTYQNTISINDDGTVNIVGSGGAYLRYNATSGQDRFRYFKSSTYKNQKAITLYKKNN